MVKTDNKVIDKLFTKGFIDNSGTNKIPEHFAKTARNVRINNGGIEPRFGYNEVYSGSDGKPYGIGYNSFTQNLYYVAGDKSVYNVDVDANTKTKIDGQDFDFFTWNNDGSQLFLLDDSLGIVYEYSLTTNYDVSTAVFNENSLNISSDMNSHSSITWNNDGSKFYILGDRTSDNFSCIFEYSMSTNFDITTAGSPSNFSIQSHADFPRGLAWNNDGSKFYVSSAIDSSVDEWTLTTNFDTSSATHNASFDSSGEDSTIGSISWNDNGSKFYIYGSVNDSVFEYDAGTNYDITSLVYNNNFLDVSSNMSFSLSFSFDSTGDNFYILSSTFGELFTYTLSTSYDITSSTGSSSIYFTRMENIDGGKVRHFSYGEYDMFLTGNGLPYYLDDNDDLLIAEDAYKASVGGVFRRFGIINDLDNPNMLRVSAPISRTNPEYFVNYKNNGAYDISFTGRIQGIATGLNRFRIITDNTIEYLSNSFLDQETGQYVPVNFADGDELANPDCIASAGDVLFYVTKDLNIRAIGYEGSISEPQLKTISDEEGLSIKDFLNKELDIDQSKAFIHVDRKNNIVKFWFVSDGGSEPDICLCWDLINSTWIEDTNKPYQYVLNAGSKQYGLSSTEDKIYEDEVGETDDGGIIEWSFETQNMALNNPTIVKQYRGIDIGGKIDNGSDIRVRVYVDDEEVFDAKIDGSGIASTAELIDFNRNISLGRLRKKGSYIRILFEGYENVKRPVLDFMTIIYRGIRRKRFESKEFTPIA